MMQRRNSFNNLLSGHRFMYDDNGMSRAGGSGSWRGSRLVYRAGSYGVRFGTVGDRYGGRGGCPRGCSPSGRSGTGGGALRERRTVKRSRVSLPSQESEPESSRPTSSTETGQTKDLSSSEQDEESDQSTEIEGTTEDNQVIVLTDSDDEVKEIVTKPSQPGSGSAEPPKTQ